MQIDRAGLGVSEKNGFFLPSRARAREIKHAALLHSGDSRILFRFQRSGPLSSEHPPRGRCSSSANAVILSGAKDLARRMQSHCLIMCEFRSLCEVPPFYLGMTEGRSHIERPA